MEETESKMRNRQKAAAQVYVVKDYETRSEIDLKLCGAYEYARHSSTQILCLAWRVGTKEELATAPTQWWSPFTDSELPDYTERDDIICVAHNAFFEEMVTRYLLTKHLKVNPRLLEPEYWQCTAALAASHALPRKLEEACKALNLPHQKNMEGHRLMMKMCKPRKATKYNKAKWHNKIEDLKKLIEYCVDDIEAETDLFLELPELDPIEQLTWVLDQKINFRGAAVDRELVDTALQMIKTETQNLNKETFELTKGAIESTTKRDKTLQWVRDRGANLENMQAGTIAEALKSNELPDEVERILEIRQAISKTSTAKYQAFEFRSRTDSRIRDTLLYHGASTGRWSGRGVQVHNFPRGTLKDPYSAVEAVKTKDIEWVRTLYGNPMNVLSSILRSVIVASEGKELFCGDFSAIEARVLFWVAGHEEGLQAYRENRDLYRELAMIIYNKNLIDITDPEREVGKRGILGSGFGMGWKKFQETCADFGQEISDAVAQKAIQAYRTIHAPVPQLWWNLEKAAISAVSRGSVFEINKTSWWVENNFLYCKLPSGRKLAYYGPEIRYTLTPWGEKRATLYHWGVDPLTKKWILSGTYGGRLTENVVQATARDVMRDSMLRLEPKNYLTLLSVHDELLNENDKGAGNLEEYNKLMARLEPWSTGIPIQVKCWTGPRYMKG